MTSLLVLVCGALLAGGAVLTIAAWRGITVQAAFSTESGRLWKSVVDKFRSTDARSWGYVALGLVGAVIGLVTLHWPLLIIVVPAAAIALPRLLSDPPSRDVHLLEALDRWVRSMLAQLSSGKSIQDALRLSGRDAPTLLVPHLAVLVRRLDQRWTAPQALAAMADDLNSADADAVLAALILSTNRGGTGASITLAALADSIQERLRALREIEAERAKPRAVVRQVTIITILTLVAFLVFSPDYFAPYSSPLGQALLGALLFAYGAAIWGMRRLTLARPRARILRELS